MTNENTTMLKSILFARWLAVCYSEVLNKQTGRWYSNRYAHFIKNVYPKQLKNGEIIKDQFGKELTHIDIMIQVYNAEKDTIKKMDKTN